MPIKKENRKLYPKNWKQIRARILERAKDTCEWSGCLAPNGELIFRYKKDLETWRLPDSIDLDAGDEECRGVIVVLTIAHVNHDPTDNPDENLLALCQLHHLRLDKEQHARNSAATRRAKKQNLELFDIAGTQKSI